MKIAFWTILGVLILIQSVAYVVWRIALQSPQKAQNDDHRLHDDEQMRPLAETVHRMIDEWNAIPYEAVSIRSFDGLKLCGRYYHQTDDAPLAICFHGYRGTPSRDFSGGARLYFDLGCNLLLIEQRAHLNSEGRSITLGVRERYDCLSWVQYAISRFGKDVKIVLTGISMGAATVLMVSGMQPPENVRGIVADAPYTSPKAIMLCVLKSMRLPPRIFYGFLCMGAWLFGGFRLNDGTANAKDAVARTSIPILLMHGEEDRFVPCNMSREIALANPAVTELHTFPNAGHGLSFLVDQPRYERIVRTFLQRILPESDAANRPSKSFSPQGE